MNGLSVRDVLRRRRWYFEHLLAHPDLDDECRKSYEVELQRLSASDLLGAVEGYHPELRREIKAQVEMWQAYREWRAGTTAETELKRFLELEAEYGARLEEDRRNRVALAFADWASDRRR
jgi:hypothetical protein